MSSRSITIEDVAKAAGVSRQTVSRVINQRPNVKQAVRERVEQAIDALGYVPNAAARRMGGAKSYLLLALIERSAVAAGVGERTGKLPLDGMLLAGMDACAKSGYHILFEQVGAQEENGSSSFSRTLTALSPDGVVLTPPLEDRKDLLDVLTKRSIPIEYLGERREFGITVPGLDDAGLSEAAAQHLIGLGHKQIGFVTGSADPHRSQRRLAGYRRAMAAARSRAQGHFVTDEGLDFSAALELAKTWLVPTIRPTAIIAETEEVALAILDVARELRIAVPKELSILSLENRASLTRSKPPISAIFQPYTRLFGEACERLIAQVQPTPEDDSAGKANSDPQAEDQREEKLPYELIERGSVTKAPRAV